MPLALVTNLTTRWRISCKIVHQMAPLAVFIQTGKWSVLLAHLWTFFHSCFGTLYFGGFQTGSRWRRLKSVSMIRLLDDDFSVISRRFGCQKFRREAEDLLARLRFTTASAEAAFSRSRFRLPEPSWLQSSSGAPKKRDRELPVSLLSKEGGVQIWCNQESWSHPLYWPLLSYKIPFSELDPRGENESERKRR